MDNDANAINDDDIDRARLQNKDTFEFREMVRHGNFDVSENNCDTLPPDFDGKKNDWVGTSKFTDKHGDGVMVEELTVRNSNRGKLAIVGGSNPGDSVSFSEFLEKQYEDQNQNETTDNSLGDEDQLSHGGIRTKILSKSGFSEYIVKDTIKGKGVIFRGPTRETIPDPRPSVSPDNEGISLRVWLKNGRNNKDDRSKSLFIFKQILDLVHSSHSQGVPLQSLRPSCFRLLPSNHVLYLDQKENTEIHGKKRKHGENRKSFGMWGQFPNRSGSAHATSHDVKSRVDGDLLEEQWYASPEDLKESCSSLSSNIYSLGVLLFELLGSFESAREHAVAMTNLRHIILPPSFLSENPKEAGYCLWMLHPEASARPTTRDILKYKFVSEIKKISTDKLLSSIAQQDIESELLLHFLTTLEQQKQKCVTKLVEDIKCIESDITDIELRQGNNLSFDTGVTSSSIKNNLNHLEKAYFSVRSSIEVPKTGSMSRENNNLDHLGIFFNGFCKYARFSKFKVCGYLRNGDFSSSANVICSLGFDRDEDYLATAGVSKKIKIYDFHMLLDDSVDIHYPAIEMPNKSKLSCICWNSYIKNYLASTDYDGAVKLWDVESGQIVSDHMEHEKRAWSVDFSRVDPTKLVSGSDDCYVKLWSINEKNSLSSIKNIANVCCVQFSPYSAHLLSFGSANYRTYCYDLRNVSTPLCILAGHERAVSYVKFLDSETIISASTDNTLKLWDLNKTSFGCLSTNACVLTYEGHTNEKNFVGLSVADGYIACGSETNEVFSYYRSMPMPITSHKFGSIDSVSGKETDHANNQFVSSVCWQQKSDMVIAANSSGCMKLLQMV